MTSLSVSRRTILAGAAIAGALTQVRQAAAETAGAAQAVLTPAAAPDVASLPRVKVKLVDPPFVGSVNLQAVFTGTHTATMNAPGQSIPAHDRTERIPARANVFLKRPRNLRTARRQTLSRGHTARRDGIRGPRHAGAGVLPAALRRSLLL